MRDEWPPCIGERITITDDIGVKRNPATDRKKIRAEERAINHKPNIDQVRRVNALTKPPTKRRGTQ